MTRIINVFTLNNIDNIGKAMIELQETHKLLPEGCTLEVYLNNDKQVSDKLPGAFFGDIVQIINFPSSYMASVWDESEAYRDQRARTAHLFASATTLSFPMEQGW